MGSSNEMEQVDLIDRQAAIDALWKALYEYEDKTEKQFIDSEELDVADWIQHRIFVQNMSDIDRQTIIGLPSAQPELSLEQVLEYCRSRCITVVEDEVLYKRLDSAYAEGYTCAESKYRKMWDEMQANIKEKAFGKRKGLIHTADIDAMPTIEERKTGKWIPVDSYSAFGGDEVMWEALGNPIAFYYCSECKEHAYAGEDGESLLTTYCPHCGARMVQEGEDNG